MRTYRNLYNTFLMAVIGGIALTSCGQNDDVRTNPGQPRASAQEVTIEIPQNAAELNERGFGDNPLIVNPGTRVTWVNRDTMPHTATSLPGGTNPDVTFDSKTLEPGESFSFTFEEPGTYPYFCEIHPNMTGTIEVRNPDDSSDNGTVLRTELTGDEEVPPVMTDATGSAVVRINKARNEIQFRVETSGLQNITVAHIHAGEVGVDGPAIFTLSDGPFTSPLTGTLTQEDFTPAAEAGVTTFEEAINAMIEGRTFINVHTKKNPDGEIRGQLQVEMEQMEHEESL